MHVPVHAYIFLLQLNNCILRKIKLNPDMEASKKRTKKNSSGDPSEGTISHDSTTSDSPPKRNRPAREKQVVEEDAGVLKRTSTN